jgi:hypothetical protein
MKLLVDVPRAVADGILTAEQGELLQRVAATDTIALAINVLLAIGVLAVSGGVLALQPPMPVVVVLGVLLAAGGQALSVKSPVGWGFLGAACVVVGALMLSGGILLEWQGHVLAFVAVSLLLLALGTAARSGLLMALTVFTIVGAMGSSTGYWHACYALWVEEPSFTIVVFAAFSLLGHLLSQRLPPDYRRVGRRRRPLVGDLGEFRLLGRVAVGRLSARLVVRARLAAALRVASALAPHPGRGFCDPLGARAALRRDLGRAAEPALYCQHGRSVRQHPFLYAVVRAAAGLAAHDHRRRRHRGCGGQRTVALQPAPQFRLRRMRLARSSHSARRRSRRAGSSRNSAAGPLWRMLPFSST